MVTAFHANAVLSWEGNKGAGSWL